MKKIIVVFLSIALNGVLISQINTNGNTEMRKILMVLSNAGYYGDSDIMTANHFEETVVPYDVFVKSGYEVDIVSPEGGRVPIGYINTSDILMAKYIHDHDFMDKLRYTQKPTDIDATDYAAIFYSGGGAAMFGVPENKSIQKIAMTIYEQNGGVISSICHGTAGLVHLKTSNGHFLVKDKKVNGFPDLFENMEADYYKQFPFSIQELINERDGEFVYAEEWNAEHYVVDGRLATGQDPSSAKVLAEQIVALLSKSK